MKRIIILFSLFSGIAAAQVCRANGQLIFNPFTGTLGCTGKTGAAAYLGAFATVTGLTVTAATHGQGTKPAGDCWDNATPANKIAQSAGFPTVSSIGDIVFAWSGSKTGYCIVSALGNQVGPTGLTGPVGSPNYTQSFTAQTSVTLTHNLNSNTVLVNCYDATKVSIEPDHLTVTDVNNIAVAFSTAQTGSCIVNASGGGGGSLASGGGTVTNLLGFLAADQPMFGNAGADAKTGTKRGSGTRAQMADGNTPALDDCAKFDINGNITTTGAPCGTGAGGLGTVTNTAGPLTLNLPLFGANGNDSKVGSARGTGTRVQLTTGTVATNDCAQFDVNGNIVSAGAACGSGGGGPGTIYVGAGISGAGTVGSPLIVDPNAVPTRLSATASLTFASIAVSTCNEQSITLVGAVTGDEVQTGAPSNIDQGFLWSAYVSLADTIKVRMCKITTGTVTPVVGVWRATIVRSF